MKNISQPVKSPGISKALTFINSSLDTGTWQQGERLPSIRRLASMAGVSLATMFKALSVLRDQGRINGIHQHRLTAGPDIGSTTDSTPLSARQRTRNNLESQILSGAFGLQGPLPSVKELRLRYGVCYRTMQKILQSLELDGVINRHGKGYRLPELNQGRQRKQIVFITLKRHLSQASALNHAYNQIANNFENECTNGAIHFEILEVDFYSPQESRAAAARLQDAETTVGYIFDAWWYSSEVFRQSGLTVLERIRRFKKPVAILDELGNFELPLQYIHDPRFQVYRIEGRHAGESFARFLLSRGHKSVAYLSIMHYASWSIDRFNGVLEQFSRVGLADSVHLCANSLAVHLPYILTVSGFKNKDILQLLSTSGTPFQIKALHEQWLDFKSSSKESYSRYPRTSPILRKNLEALSAIARRKIDPCFLEKTVAGALEAVGISAFEQLCTPIFDQALEQNSTAWICANDEVAFKALEYLQSKHKLVPNDISVVGFDNEPVKALEKRLTTFDFNASGFVHRILNFILHPSRTRGRYRHQTIEVEGMIIERETVGRRR